MGEDYHKCSHNCYLRQTRSLCHEAGHQVFTSRIDGHHDRGDTSRVDMVQLNAEPVVLKKVPTYYLTADL